MNRFLISLLIISVTSISQARLNPSSPSGQFDYRPAKMNVPGTRATKCVSDGWADDFLGHIQDRLKEKDNYHAKVAMQSIRLGMENEPEFCKPPMKTDAGVALFMLVMAEALFVEESGCRPSAVNPHAPNGNAVGFGQMGVQDAQNHGCKRADGGAITNISHLKDSRTNAMCVAQIAMNCAAGLPNQHGYMRERRHYGHLAYGNNGKFGAFGCFWQPVRAGMGGDGKGGKVNNTADRNRIMSVTREFCETAAQGTDALVRNGFVTEDSLCQATTGSECRFRMAAPFQRRPSRSSSRRTTL